MADSDQIKVVIRIRPLIHREHQNDQDNKWIVKEEKMINQKDQTHLPPYVFDHIFDRDSSTWDLYGKIVAPIVEAAMNGYHGTVFAYGQSGSGKTHTISGSKLEAGIIGFAMQDIFDFIEQKPSHEFLMRASYMEIYNEKIFDLLSNEDKILKLQETTDHQINVVGLDEKLVNSCEQVLEVIKNGEARRTVAETRQNDRSSRSHCIFRIIIESRIRNGTDDAVMVSHLNFVDLAGSEKAGDNTGDRLKEGCAINKSLFCLSHVISKLSEGISNQFINYRDSKLTRILQNALGGNSKTAIICTVNPTAAEESHSTLKFATRAKTIKNKPHVNEVLSEAAMLKKYRNEITRLQKIVADMGVQNIQILNEDLKKQLDEKQLLIKQLTQQIVVSSSLSDTSSFKKKMRRETWCAPKLQRKSHFPSLSSVFDHRQVTIQEESPDVDRGITDDLMLGLDSFDLLPASAYSFASENVAGAKYFLRVSEGDELLECEDKGLSPESKIVKQVVENETQTVGIDFEKSELSIRLEHENYLLVEENNYLQKALSHLEKQNRRLEESEEDLYDRIFHTSLLESEVLLTQNQVLQDHIKELQTELLQSSKKIQELEKALAGQEPYIARLEQQLDMQIELGSGHLSGGARRRSGIPVAVKKELERNSTQPLEVSAKKSLESTVIFQNESEITTAKVMKDAEVSTESCMFSLQDFTTDMKTSAGFYQTEKILVDAEVLTEEDYLCSSNMSFTVPRPESSQMCRTYVQSNEAFEETHLVEPMQETSEMEGHSSEYIIELMKQLREKVLELDKFERENEHIQEMLNQANAEIVRYKKAIEAMEQLDAERLDELEELPKLRSLLVRRDMEIQRLEAQNEHLKDELGHGLLNNSGLSSPFSEKPRRSVLLAEREEEVWQLKERTVGQAQQLEDLQQEKNHLEDLVIDLRAQLDQQSRSFIAAKSRISGSSASSNLMDDSDIKEDSGENEVIQSNNQYKINEADLDYFRSMLYNKESQISRLETLLQEKDDELDDLFEKNILIPREVALTRMREYDEQKSQLELLSEQLAVKELELKKLRANKELQEKASAGLGKSTENSFQENLIMEKITLEENLQEKIEELTAVTLEKKELEFKLNERRCLVNELRQHTEQLTELLQQSQKELTDLKQTHTQSECVGKNENDHLEMFSFGQKHYLKSTIGCTCQHIGKKQLQCTECISIPSAPLDQTDLTFSTEKGLVCSNLICSLNSSLNHPFSASLKGKESECADIVSTASSLKDLSELALSRQREQDLLDALTQKENEMTNLLMSLDLKKDDKAYEKTPKIQMSDKEVETTFILNEAHEKTLRKQISDAVVETSFEYYREALEKIQTADVEIETSFECRETIEKIQSADAEVETSFDCNEAHGKIQTAEAEVETSFDCNKAHGKIQMADGGVATLFELNEADEKMPRKQMADAETETTFICSSEELSFINERKAALQTQLLDLVALEEVKKSLELTIQNLEATKDEKEVLDSKVQVLQSQLVKMEEENSNLDKKVQDFAAVIEEKNMLESRIKQKTADLEILHEKLCQINTDLEELKTELLWQTQVAEALNVRNEELQDMLAQQKIKSETEIEELLAEKLKLTQEAEEMVQELENANRLQEDAEQCRKITEETLEEYKLHTASLELSRQKLAEERDLLELREEASCKEQSKLRMMVDALENKSLILERELKNAVHSKELLQSALAEKESAQQIGESLHEKLSRELMESQAEVLGMQTQLHQLQQDLQLQIKNATTLEEELSHLKTERSHLEGTLKRVEDDNLHLVAALSESKSEMEKERALLQTHIDECHDEISSLNAKLQSTIHQAEKKDDNIQMIQSERDEALGAKSVLMARVLAVEGECQELRKYKEQQQREMEDLQKELSLARVQSGASISSVETPGGVVSLTDIKKEKIILKCKIRDLTAEVEKLQKICKLKDNYMEQLMSKVEEYEDKESKCETDEKIKELSDSLKRKELEISSQQSRHKKEMEKVEKKLSIAEENIVYKETVIARLKGEFRRIKAQENSFCAPVLQKQFVPSPVKVSSTNCSIPVGEERIISSHSGIIDRYTVTLLEADKYQLQKELRKSQALLRKTESELHWVKVSLSKYIGEGRDMQPSGSQHTDFTAASSVDCIEGSSQQSGSQETGNCTCTHNSVDSTEIGSQGSTKSKTLHQESICSSDHRLTMPCSLESSVDSFTETEQQQDTYTSPLPQKPLILEKILVERMKDRNHRMRTSQRRPSLLDKENVPLQFDVSFHEQPKEPSRGICTAAESPLKEQEFWRKLSQPSIKKPFLVPQTRPVELKKNTRSEQCKQQ